MDRKRGPSTSNLLALLVRKELLLFSQREAAVGYLCLLLKSRKWMEKIILLVLCEFKRPKTIDLPSSPQLPKERKQNSVCIVHKQLQYDFKVELGQHHSTSSFFLYQCQLFKHPLSIPSFQSIPAATRATMTIHPSSTVGLQCFHGITQCRGGAWTFSGQLD